MLIHLWITLLFVTAKCSYGAVVTVSDSVSHGKLEPKQEFQYTCEVAPPSGGYVINIGKVAALTVNEQGQENIVFNFSNPGFMPIAEGETINKKLANETSRYSVQVDNWKSVITVKDSRSYDSGVWVCEVRQEDGTPVTKTKGRNVLVLGAIESISVAVPPDNQDIDYDASPLTLVKADHNTVFRLEQLVCEMKINSFVPDVNMYLLKDGEENYRMWSGLEDRRMQGPYMVGPGGIIQSYGVALTFLQKGYGKELPADVKKKYNGGMFVCAAAGKEASVGFLGIYKPEISCTASNTTIACMAKGYPLATIVWFFSNKTEIVSTPSFTITEQEDINSIRSTMAVGDDVVGQLSDDYEFKIKATNTHGSDTIYWSLGQRSSGHTNYSFGCLVIGLVFILLCF